MPFAMQRAVVAEYHPLVTDSNIPLFYVYINSFLPDVCNLSFYTSLFLHMVPYQKWGGGSTRPKASSVPGQLRVSLRSIRPQALLLAYTKAHPEQFNTY